MFVKRMQNFIFGDIHLFPYVRAGICFFRIYSVIFVNLWLPDKYFQRDVIDCEMFQRPQADSDNLEGWVTKIVHIIISLSVWSDLLPSSVLSHAVHLHCLFATSVWYSGNPLRKVPQFLFSILVKIYAQY